MFGEFIQWTSIGHEYRTDRSMTHLQITTDEIKHGRGFGKLNNSVKNNKLYNFSTPYNQDRFTVWV